MALHATRKNGIAGKALTISRRAARAQKRSVTELDVTSLLAELKPATSRTEPTTTGSARDAMNRLTKTYGI